MQIDPSSLSRREAYALLVSVVVPRPIAWVSSVAADGTPNLAPFSFYNGVTSQPPIIAIAVGARRGKPKDTTVNIRQSGEFVVNVVSEELADTMVSTSADFTPDVDEFAQCGVAAAPSVHIRPPRVAQAPVAMECRLERIVEVGDPPTALILGEVVCFHVRDDLWTGSDVDVQALRPLARLHRALYAPLGTPREIPRPVADRDASRR